MLNKLLIIGIFLLSTFHFQAQNQSSEGDAIKSIVLNYIENFFENNFDEMNSSLHPRLAKRGLNSDGTMSKDLPPEELKKILSKKKAFPLEKQNNTVEDISIFGNMASATLITGYSKMRWKEYIHLVKSDGDWKMINVFWEYYPLQKQRKKKSKD